MSWQEGTAAGYLQNFFRWKIFIHHLKFGTENPSLWENKGQNWIFSCLLGSCNFLPRLHF